MYDKIKYKNNYNYIEAEIDIKENDINKNIRIINSFEQSRRENKNNLIHIISGLIFLNTNKFYRIELNSNCHIRKLKINIQINIYYNKIITIFN